MIHFFKKIEDIQNNKITGKKYLDNIIVENSVYDAYEAKRKIPFANQLFEEKINLFIDLSQVQFAPLSSIHFLILHLDNICKKEEVNEVFIALPTLANTQKELKSNKPTYTEENKKEDKRKRGEANSFIKNVNFIGAIKDCLKIYNIIPSFTEKFEFSSELDIGKFKEAFEILEDLDIQTPPEYHYLYPLEWIPAGSELNYKTIQKNFENTLADNQRGLHPLDVNAIKNVLFYELHKNIIDHAKKENSNPKRFLFSLGLIKRTIIDSTNVIEKPFFEFLQKENVPNLVEIFFGDTGGGFFTKDYKEKSFREGYKTPSEQLKWAFRRWSTRKNNEKRRGTKGLYRILRIANNYNGLVQINTNGYEGGFILGSDWKCRKSKQQFDGAFLQIRLCPYSVLKEFKFEAETAMLKRNWKTISLDLNEEISNKIQAEFKESEDKNYFFILDIDKLTYINGNFTDEIEPRILPVLIDISDFSHPSGAVVYINSKEGTASISNLINTVHEFMRVQKKSALNLEEESENEIIYDPVIVIYEGETYWYGGDNDIIEILNELYKGGFQKTLNDLKYFKSLKKDSQERIKLYFSKDNRLVIADSRTWEIKLNFTNLQKHFSDLFIQRKEKLVKNQKNKTYCSPKIELIKNWIDVKELIKEHEHGFALSLYLKLLEEEKKGNFSLDGELFILIDHVQHKDLAVSFSKLLPNLSEERIVNIQEQIQIKSLKRFKLFRENSKVIILTSLIGTSETIRRLIKYAWRDNAYPLAILCIGNYREGETISTIETWGAKTNILSIYQQNSDGISEEVPKDFKYFEDKNNSLLKYIGEQNSIIQPNYNIEHIIENQLVSEDLLETLKMAKALHYNHIGIKNDRHFTFYANKNQLLRQKTIIWDKVKEEIINWKADRNILKFKLFIKEDLVPSYETNPFYEFLKSINKNIELFSSPPIFQGTKSEKLTTEVGYSDIFSQSENLNVFIIDFGIISGDSVNGFLNGVSNIENLHICILFNQEIFNRVMHYKRISSLYDGINSNISVKINFLFDLPLSYFSIDNCPICNHKEALDIYKMSDNPKDYMFLFSEDRQEKLEIITKKDIEDREHPFDFYPSRKSENERHEEFAKHELSSELLIKMFKIKIFLDDSQSSTYSRIKLYNLIFSSFKNREKEFLLDDSNLYAILYLFSFEVHWFQKEPLIFKDYREMISEIAIYVSTCDFDKLKKQFEDQGKKNIIGLIVRFKYAAISVLRSTHKLKFCKNLFLIISNSKYDGHYSDNLLQNSFYHTYSILKNKYNKSEVYFRELQKSYDKIKSISDLNPVQRETSIKLYFLQYSKLTEIDIANLNDLELIRRAKDFIKESYTWKNHPQLQENLTDLVLVAISDEALKDIRINRELSKRYFQLETPFINGGIKWDETQRYLYKNVIPIYNNFSNSLKNSIVFKDEYQLTHTFESILPTNVYSILHKFNQLLLQLSVTPLLYLDYKEDYDNTLNFILDRIIKRNSDYLLFLEQFPLDISSFLKNDKVLKSTFKTFDLVIKTTSKAFYPISRFKKDIDLIINSIYTRLKPEFKIDDTESLSPLDKIHFKTVLYEDNDEFINLKLSYNGTSSDSHKHNKYQIGGLESIENEIINFGGMLIFKKENDSNGYFNITFKFLKYE